MATLRHCLQRPPAKPPLTLSRPTFGRPRRGTERSFRPANRVKTPMGGPPRAESRIPRTIAAQMVKSASTIPHVTNFDDADVTDLEKYPQNDPTEYVGPTAKLTALPFAVKAIGAGPAAASNAQCLLDEEKEEVVYKQYVNVGVAVDTPAAGGSRAAKRRPEGRVPNRSRTNDDGGAGPCRRVLLRRSPRRNLHRQQPRRGRRRL